MKKIFSTAAVSVFALSVFTSTVCASDYTFIKVAEGTFAKPVISVTLPKSMAFVFDPYSLNVKGKGSVDKNGTVGKIICSYVDSDDDAWVVTNTSDIPIRAGVYVYTGMGGDGEFQVRDAAVNTVDTSDETRKYLLLDIKATGGSSGTKKVTLLDDKLRTDEGENSKTVNLKAGWWSDENEGTITVINDVQKNGKVEITLTGTTQNVGDLDWSKKDKAMIYFVFSFDAEPTTGS